MTGTIREILTVRGALVRALLAAQRNLATATTKELKRLYAGDESAITSALRVIEGSSSQLSAAEIRSIEALLAQDREVAS